MFMVQSKVYDWKHLVYIYITEKSKLYYTNILLFSNDSVYTCTYHEMHPS